MTWSTARADLRVLLSDGPTDKLMAFKQVFGNQAASATVFKTFEKRRITDFSSTATDFPLGLYLSGQRLAASACTTDNPETGFFVMAEPPTDANQLLATYYVQWFTDAELDGFLEKAAGWLNGGTDISLTQTGLQAAALQYANYEAMQKLSIMYATNPIETYRLEDSPNEKFVTMGDKYRAAANAALKQATQLRDDFYQGRKGAALAPRFGTIQGSVKNPTVG
jgi:hypothetical protein